MLALLMCIFVCSVNCAPADDGETTTLSFETTTTTTALLPDTRINEVDGKSPNDEVLEEFSTPSTTTTEEMTTESEIDKRFDIEETTMMTTKQSLVEATKDSIMDDKIEISTSLPAVLSLSDHTNARIMQHYREMLRSQFLRTLLVTLSELKKRQMQQQQHQEELQESQVIETSMPYSVSSKSISDDSDCECEIDDVSSSDDGKVIVFDESTGKYVYVDGKDLDEKIQERNAQHVSEIQC